MKVEMDAEDSIRVFLGDKGSNETAVLAVVERIEEAENAYLICESRGEDKLRFQVPGLLPLLQGTEPVCRSFEELM